MQISIKELTLPSMISTLAKMNLRWQFENKLKTCLREDSCASIDGNRNREIATKLFKNLESLVLPQSRWPRFEFISAIENLMVKNTTKN